ncbi:hypothetical protein K504DRAFT_439215 [Pleomassaria siparia CBS 279.74]|uniref:Mis12-Mtw1 family protein n=1 Tax=Pleomassaria siparia CBS 279.74 TaxID=1314801 RepID=A0A6G1K048_9PLEO|nr:hypothetical protein K504DRAFT_439215 [Pleomassaria siparia CBS 279.74]
MNAVYARSPLQQLHHMATNRSATRRKSAKHPFEDEDAPPPAKRPKTEISGTGRRMNGATKKAAKATAYDEDDDGFQFTRRTTRRSTAKAQSAPEPEPPTEKPVKPAPSRRKKDTAAAAPEPAQSETQVRRRSARLSTDKEQLEAHAEEAQTTKRVKKSAPVEKKKKKQVTPVPESQPAKSVPAKVGVQTPNELHVSKKRDGAATKVMLPFADTPVIARNKEMRKGSKNGGHRRSSTGMRGRRASSLMDSGLSNALPHSEVEVRDYFKYIEQSQPEPRRMKQLLTWCGSKALPAKPSGNVKDSNAIMSARAIQLELIEDFANNPELSDWFSREDAVPATTVVKRPNPQNTSMQTAMEELEEEIKRLEVEKAAWDDLSKSTVLPPSPPTIHTSIPSLVDIDPSLLDPSQASILAALKQPQLPELASDHQFTFTTTFALQTHVSNLSSTLEPHIDVFADGVHKIEQYRNTAERVASRVLGTAAQRLEERDRESKEKVGSEGIGVGDVLRSLAGVLNDS